MISYVYAKAQITIYKPFIRAIPPNAKMTAGYMVIKNHSSVDINLLNATSTIAKKIELHTVKMLKGSSGNMMMKMEPVPFITIPAKGEVDLKKGSYHLMIMGLKRSLQVGEPLRFTLYFSNGEKITKSIRVKKQ